jgi:8-amino-7-oxononanoate synthase
VLVAVDGIYSMEGDRAPLVEIAEVCQTFGARLLVDEAHALGVVGPAGAGTAAEAGVEADVVMGTFSKSLASCGGFIAGSADLIEFLKITCRPLMFTASGVPAALAAALAAARIARDEDWRREALLARAAQLRAGLRALGFDAGGADGSPIVPVWIGDLWRAGHLWKALLEEGVYTNCAIPPAVAKAVLRTSVMATHTEQDIAAALEGFAQAQRRVEAASA